MTKILRRRRNAAHDGFSLIEVIVALTIFAVAALASVPLVLNGLRASSRTRVETLAKDISQLRIEKLRNLNFHVDQQNGPFIDLLDRYFTNASTTAGALANGEAGCVGQFVASPGTGGTPTGNAYRTTCTDIPGAAGFTQVIYTQFLKQTGVPVDPPTTYDSQIAGQDGAVTQLLGMTVLTSYVRGTQRGTLRTYTEISDSRSSDPLVTTQAQVAAIKVTSNNAATGRILVAQTGYVKADGSLTSGSLASVQTAGASVENVGVSQSREAVATAFAPLTTSPANPAGSSAAGPTANNPISNGAAVSSTYGSWAACGWGWFGNSGYENVSSTTASGIPSVPSNVGSDATAVTNLTQSGLRPNGGGCAGYAFGFRNWLTVPSYSSSLGISTAKPLVYMPNSGSGSSLATGLAVGQGAVSATSFTSSAHASSATALARSNQLNILPLNAASFANGLVNVTLTSARLSCSSNSDTTLAYDLTVNWPGGSAHLVRNADGTVSGSLPMPSTISFSDGTTTRLLSDYLNWDLVTSITEAGNGASTIDHVFGLTVPSSVVGDGGFGVEIGQLTCTAEDNR